VSPLLLVFSDLDGSLLDHHDYSFEAALPALDALRRQGIPLIFCSSKTRAEIEPLRSLLGNTDPFIVENGAAVFIPEGTLELTPPDCRPCGDGWVREFAPPRQRWLAELARLQPAFGEFFTHFAAMGLEGVMAATGLEREAAARALQRDYSEPVQWWGSAERREAFVAALVAAGATVLQGGRFLAVAGGCDKGAALSWLRDCYRRENPARDVHDLAIGDSSNDSAMLERARHALIIRSPVHGFPPLRGRDNARYSQAFGPAGWAEGVLDWLQCLDPTSQE
jgi:mannosyl-3-phosphoglycerate phosphatase family protein